MRRARAALAGSAVVVLAQVFHAADLVDVVSGGAPAGVHLSYPLGHVVFAPFTLLADYINGGSVTDLKSFAIWAVMIYVLARLTRSRAVAVEIKSALVFLVALALFVWWGARWIRPIPALVADDSSLIIFDTHSHTAASHDGRKGFSEAVNAQWHRRAGFDAAFITDHNVFGAARQWQHDRAGRPPRLLDGEELSLSGLHMVVLGNDSLIRNHPWDASFDSSLSLITSISPPRPSPPLPDRPFVIASLPEYAKNHWGEDMARLIAAGTEGLEIWTTSPKAMEFTPQRRREVIARARSSGIALFGATDMHGLGYAASVWNVMALPGWRSLADSALARTLIASFRARPTDVRVIARPRVFGSTRLARAFAFPAGMLGVLRGASRGHALALVAWCWFPVLVATVRRRSPSA